MTTPSDSRSSSAAPSDPAGGSFLRDVLPALAWTALVFVLGGGPNPGPPVPLEFPIDKIEHAIAFGILQWLALRALRYELPHALPRAMPWIAALVSTVVGGALELYQLTVPNRSAEFADLVSDAIGAGIAAFVTARIRANVR